VTAVGGPVPRARPIVCLGDVMVDVVTRLAGALVPASDSSGAIAIRGGGSAANTACWIASTGAPTTLIGAVGRDAFGDWVTAEIAAFDVDARVVRDERRATGVCVVLVAADGERTMIPDTGANAGLRAEHLEVQVLRSAARLHVSGYALLGAGRHAALAALRTAREAGVPISVDAGSSAPIRAVGTTAYFDVLGQHLLLLANVDEADVLTGEREPSVAARRLATRIGGEAVVKCGASGAYWSDGREVQHAPTRPVDALDTTGAGDAFAAGMLVGLRAGVAPLAAMARGNDLARRACGIVGGRPEPVESGSPPN